LQFADHMLSNLDSNTWRMILDQLLRLDVSLFIWYRKTETPRDAFSLLCEIVKSRGGGENRRAVVPGGEGEELDGNGE